MNLRQADLQKHSWSNKHRNEGPANNGYNRAYRRSGTNAPVAQPGRCDDSLKHCLGNPIKQARVTSSNLVRGSNPKKKQPANSKNEPELFAVRIE